jgi:soluble lytic murein transglycosylase-like protein
MIEIFKNTSKELLLLRRCFSVISLLALLVASAPIMPPKIQAETAIPFQEPIADLPKPLSQIDVARYQKIFALQHAKNWKKADQIIKKLDDDLLLGRVLSQRYLHPTGWRSTYEQLQDWLQHYNDHPAASRIYWLSKRRRPENAEPQNTPKKGYLDGYGRSSLGRNYVNIPVSNKQRAAPGKTREIVRNIRRNIRRGRPMGGLGLLTKSNLRHLTKYEEAVLRADIAHGFFIYGKDQRAIAQAEKSINIAGMRVPQAYWTAGIAAWRSGDIDHALDLFRSLAKSKDASATLIASSAFWASRGELRQGNAEASFDFLALAARHQDTFYGILAAEALGQDVNLDFDLPAVSPRFIDWLMARPGGQRMFALLQVGETYHASREMRYLWEEMNNSQHVEAMTLAARSHMAGLSFRAADIIRQRGSGYYYGGLYPVPDFKTADPIRIDQALLLAVMRQESGFNPRAKSWAKASGLMQLMPATAAFISRDRRFRDSRRHDLMVPEINIKISEDYILHLLDEALIEEDLVKLLAAYNGGPGNLKKWMNGINYNDDTLMLLESLPSRETRFYVKNVMTNLWIYRKRLNQDAPAIAHLVAMGLAQYTPFAGTGHKGDCQLTKLSERCQ